MTLHKINRDDSERVRQGDIYSNVPYYESYCEHENEFSLTVYDFPYVLVLTQDCDLEQNKRTRDEQPEGGVKRANDKHLISVIVVPLYNSEHFWAGEHLSEIGLEAQKQNSGLKKTIKSNQNQRYHYIEFGDDVVIPDSVIDFKHYFSTSLDWLETHREKRMCGVESVYRELISQRFSNYLSRIGLPEPN